MLLKEGEQKAKAIIDFTMDMQKNLKKYEINIKQELVKIIKVSKE